MQRWTRLLAVGVILVALPVAAKDRSGLTRKDARVLDKASDVLSALTTAPDQGIPNELLGRAECILVFPSVAKGAFIVGGEYGRGVATCRQNDGRMGAPAFFSVGAASVGFQWGGKSTDFVLLVMNDDGMSHLLQDEFKLGAEASAAVGPVGRDTRAATDLQLQAQMLSWSRAKGLFVGASLDGAVVKASKDANARLYGHDITARHILLDGNERVPAAARPFVDTARSVSVAEDIKEARNQ